MDDSMLKIEIAPGYEHLHDFLVQLPLRFEQGDDKTIHVGRNLIKVMEVDGLLLNVKRYHVPSFLNRIVYSFFRTPKGKRAFTYPRVLLQKGFETPQPVAYVEERIGGLIGYSFFISLQCPYRRKFYEFGNADIEECREVVTAFANLTARLHEAGIYHCDYSPGNILFDYVDGRYHFSLVDINRMEFGPVNLEKGCANFARLWGQKGFFMQLAKDYALARGADEDYCLERILYYRRKFWLRYMKRHKPDFNLEL